MQILPQSPKSGPGRVSQGEGAGAIRGSQRMEGVAHHFTVMVRAR